MFGGNDERDDELTRKWADRMTPSANPRSRRATISPASIRRVIRGRNARPLDEIREEIEYDMSPDGPTLPAGPVPPGRDVADFDVSQYTTSRAPQIRQRGQRFVEDVRQDSGGGAGGILPGLIALAPGARILGVSFGCFVVMLVVGCCGIVAVLVALLLRR